MLTAALEIPAPAPRLVLRRTIDPQAVLTTESDGGPAGDRGRVLACSFCRRPITTSEARIDIQGAHAHSFANPDGLRFRVGCFAQASGLALVGPRSAYFTWFPGYTWQVALCGNCHEQLGWFYRSADACFHGLILERLREAEEES